MPTTQRYRSLSVVSQSLFLLDCRPSIETSLDVEFSVDLIKRKKINWPRLENQDFIMVLGSSRALIHRHETEKFLCASHPINCSILLQPPFEVSLKSARNRAAALS